MTFSSLGLNADFVKVTVENDYLTPTPVQLKTIPEILLGHDVMARAQTGTGKTAAFALPLLQRLQQDEQAKPVDTTKLQNKLSNINVLVLTPTRELAQQVHKSFIKYAKHTDINIALAHGGVSIKPQIEQLKQGAQVLIATPGRLLDHLINGSLVLDTLHALVFDEADRMLDLGFKDEIANILKRVPVKRQTLLFSATFDDNIYKLSKSLLTNAKRIEIDQQNTAADRVEQVIYVVDADKKAPLLSYMIGSKNWQQVLIFTRTKQTADLLAKELVKDGIKALAIHGDKSQGARDKALLSFKEHTIRALVATDVAARGLDIADLSYVVNYELPYIAEDYVHRIGRTGRAGKQGLAVSLMSPSEEWLLTAVEEVIENRVLQQWYPGYEPDLTKQAEGQKTVRKPISKQKSRQLALNKSNNRNPKSKRRH